MQDRAGALSAWPRWTVRPGTWTWSSGSSPRSTGAGRGGRAGRAARPGDPLRRAADLVSPERQRARLRRRCGPGSKRGGSCSRGSATRCATTSRAATSVVTRMRWSGELAIDAGPWPQGTTLSAWCVAHYRLAEGRIVEIEQHDCYEPVERRSDGAHPGDRGGGAGGHRVLGARVRARSGGRVVRPGGRGGAGPRSGAGVQDAGRRPRRQARGGDRAGRVAGRPALVREARRDGRRREGREARRATCSAASRRSASGGRCRRRSTSRRSSTRRST